MLNINMAKHELSDLLSYMRSNRSLVSDNDWGGADVIISSKELSNQKLIDWHSSGKILVVTKYSRELSWLFIQLRDIYFKHNIIDYASKYSFFGRLGDAAICSIQKHGDDKDEMLNNVLSEAFLILDELIPKQQLYN